MKQIKQIRVFVSSPNDMAEERDMVAAICDQISQDIGSVKGFVVDAIRWETHTVSSRAERSQEAINQQLGVYDIYVGLMGFYFGTATGKYASGTEEEFEDALALNEHGGHPLIQFYFSKAKVDIDEIDNDQYSRVKSFRKKLGEKGVYYQRFADIAQLQTLVRKGLTKQILEIFDSGSLDGVDFKKSQEQAPEPSYKSLRPYEVLKNLKKVFSDDPVVASGYHLHEAVQGMQRMTAQIETVGGRADKITNALRRSLNEINKFNDGRSKNPSRAIKEFGKTNELMSEFVYWLAEEIPLMASNFYRTIADFQRGTIIQRTFSLSTDEELEESFKAADFTKGEFMKLAEAVKLSGEAIPEIQDLGGTWEASRRTYIAITKDFHAFLLSACTTLSGIRELVFLGGESDGRIT